MPGGERCQERTASPEVEDREDTAAAVAMRDHRVQYHSRDLPPPAGTGMAVARCACGVRCLAASRALAERLHVLHASEAIRDAVLQDARARVARWIGQGEATADAPVDRALELVWRALAEPRPREDLVPRG